MISSRGLSEGPNLLQGDSPLCWHMLKPKSIQALIFSDSPAETSKSCSCSFNGGQKHQSTGQSVREQAVRQRSQRCGVNWGHQQRHWEDGWSFLGLPVSYVGNRLGGQSYEFCHPKAGVAGCRIPSGTGPRLLHLSWSDALHKTGIAWLVCFTRPPGKLLHHVASCWQVEGTLGHYRLDPQWSRTVKRVEKLPPLTRGTFGATI